MAKYNKKRVKELQHDRFRDTTMSLFDRLANALEAVKANEAWVVDQQISLCEIEAPPFKEQKRAEAYKAVFESLGLLAVVAALFWVARRASPIPGPARPALLALLFARFFPA